MKNKLNEEFSIQDVAELLGIHRHTVSKLLETKQLAGLTVRAIYAYAYNEGKEAREEEIIQLVRKS